MLAESQLGVDVFAEVVVADDVPVDAHVDVPDLLVDSLLADHDVLDRLVGDVFVFDELGLARRLDEDDLVVVDLLDLDLNHVVHADVLLDALLVDEPALAESVLVLLVLDVLLSPEGSVADHDGPEELAGHDGNLVVHLDVHCRCQLLCSRWDRLVEVAVETTLLHRILPDDGSIRDVHLDTSRDPDTDDANVLDAIRDVDLDDTNLLDAIILLVVLLPPHLLMDDVTNVVHLVASLDVDVPLLLPLLLRP